jgi:hypothetical protein
MLHKWPTHCFTGLQSTLKFDVAAGKVWMAIISTTLLIVEKDQQSCTTEEET